MTVHHARIALAAVLVGISALGSGTRLHAQQPLADLPLDELRALAEQGDADAQSNLGACMRPARASRRSMPKRSDGSDSRPTRDTRMRN